MVQLYLDVTFPSFYRLCGNVREAQFIEPGMQRCRLNRSYGKFVFYIEIEEMARPLGCQNEIGLKIDEKIY